jgi:hypothetical protein
MGLLGEEPGVTRQRLNGPTIRVPLDLSSHRAQALAQFVKRLSWSAMRECAVDDTECYEIRAAIDTLQGALARVGYAPR